VTAISVIICTHNPRKDYFERVLHALRAQTLPQNQWELLIVDNASAHPIAPNWDISWHADARHVREEQLGLSLARLRGIAETNGEVLVFVDDDNVLADNYLNEALRIAAEWPQLGVWGSGCTLPEFELEPPDKIRRYIHYLTIVDINAPRWTNIPNCYDAFPCGAGVCLRASVGSAYRTFYESSEIRVTGRRGTDLLSGEDAEICHVACDMGFGMGIFPDLKLTHLIPQRRLTSEYLIRLVEGIHFSGYLVNFKHFGHLPTSPHCGIELLRFIKYGALRRGIDRQMFLARRRAMRRARAIVRDIKANGANVLGTAKFRDLHANSADQG